MKPALAQVSTLSAPFEVDVEDYAAGKCPAIDVWLGKLETYLDTHTTDDVRRLLDSHEVAAPVASFQGGLFTSQRDARTEHWEHFHRRLALCEQLGIGTLVVAADVAGPITRQEIQGVSDSLAQAADLAAEHAVQLALEFQARAAFCNNLQTAAALVEQVDRPQLGICLDAFHYCVGPSKPEDLALLTTANLLHVQLCDLSGTPRELATDADRILPGDGDLPLEPLIARLRAISYEGHVSVELMNPQIWQVAPRSFGEIAMTALRKILGQAG